MDQRQYVVRFDYGDGPEFAVCTTERMIKAIENAHYSGEDDDARYFSYFNDGFVEVEFRCLNGGTGTDEDDYFNYEYGVFRKDSPRGDQARPVEKFSVRIDGRA